jgi:tetratricopeptide (TPR) repeat protein
MVTAAWAGSDWDTHFTRGEGFERAGRYEQAAREFESALHEAERGPEDVKLPVTWNNLGVVYRALGRTHEAEACYLRAIAFYEKRTGFDAPLATALENLAALHLTLGALSKAEPLYRRSYEIRVKALPPAHPAIAQSLQGLAGLEQERHRPEKAEAYYRRALGIQESAFGSMSPSIAPTLHNLASVLTETGRIDEARALYERTLAIYRAGMPGHPAEAVVLRHLAELDARGGDFSRADAKFQEALGICERTLPPGHPQAGAILQAYGYFLNQAGRRKEARAVSARANDILIKGMRDSGSAYTVEVNTLRGK